MTTGFLANLIRFGLVIGLWLGIVLSALYSAVYAVIIAAACTLLTAGLIAWDAHKAWELHNSNPEKEQ